MQTYLLDNLKNLSSGKKAEIIKKQSTEINRLRKTKLKLKKENKGLTNDKEQLFYSLEYVIAHMPGFVYWKDLDSKYMGCNDNLVKVSGLNDRSEIVGKTDYDFDWGKNQADQFVKDDQYIIQTKQTLTTEYELPIKKEDGNYLYVRTDKMPFFDKDGNVIGILAIAIDVTEQKILENKLKVEIEKSELANKAKTQFIQNMEHDIRTPFCGVYGLAQILYHRETDKNKKDVLKDIYGSAKELYDYCNTILDFSNIEKGSLPIIEKSMKLKEVIDSVVTMEIPAAKLQKLKLVLEYDPVIPTEILGDEYRLKRILINLVGNAIKFTDKGSVTLSVKLAKKIDNKNIILKFIVSDTGVGIPPSKQNIIYEKFSKLVASNKGLYKGTGLGLAIVKQFIHELNGEMSLESELGSGSKFICIIPFQIPLLAQ